MLNDFENYTAMCGGGFVPQRVKGGGGGCTSMGELGTGGCVKGIVVKQFSSSL